MMSEKNGGKSYIGQTTERKHPPEWPHSRVSEVMETRALKAVDREDEIFGQPIK